MTTRLGKILVGVCQTWKAAEEEIGELIIIFESVWVKTTLQIGFVERIVRELEQEHRLIIESLCITLAQKLSAAVTNIQKVAPPGTAGNTRSGFWSFGQKVDKPVYVRMKSNLRSVIQELDDWHRRFDPSWLLLIRISKPTIDEELSRGVQEQNAAMHNDYALASTHTRDRRSFASAPFSTAQRLRAALQPESERHDNIYMSVIELETFPILYSNACVARPRIRNADWYIIDSVRCPRGSNVSVIHRDVRQLAHKLKQADSFAFGLLSCRGVMRIKDSFSNSIKSFDFVFSKPDGLDVLQSLRQSLLSNTSNMSLNRRLRIAKEVVKGISYVHTFNFVHKNVRPESVLLFEDTTSSRCSTFLVGFEGFRCADGPSAMLGDVDWHKNLYRHPSRQGEHPREYYKMQHDIYSLGVCLLEVGLWESFVSYTDDLYPEPGQGLHTLQAWVMDNCQTEDAYSSRYKDYFTDMARNRLPLVMGERYTDIVTTCLTCLDNNNDGIGSEAELNDEDGVLVGVRFIQQVLLKMDEIVI